MTDLRYGLIGAGMMGQEHIRNVHLLPGAQVAAIFDPDPGMRAAAQELAPEAAAAASLEALLARDDLDALIVASPNDSHVAQLEAIAAARPLPVIVEKPLFIDAGELARLEAFQARYPAPVWVAMEYRYMPPIAALIDAAHAATGGIRMLTIREHRYPFLSKVGHWNRYNARSGGTLVEKCCHFFDLMRLILDDEPVRVAASADQAVNHRDEGLPEPADVWDNAYVIVDFARGARAMLELCMFAEGSEYQEELTAVGPEGKIEAKVPGPARFWPADLGPLPVPKLVLSRRNPRRPETRVVPVPEALLAAGDHNGGTFYQHQRFAEVVRGTVQPEVTLADGKRAVLMGLAAQEAALEHRVVEMALHEPAARRAG